MRLIIDQDPAELLPLPRLSRFLPKTLNQEQVTSSAGDQSPKSAVPLRDCAILELFYASGLRISELAGARLENLNLQETNHSSDQQRGEDQVGAGRTGGL